LLTDQLTWAFKQNNQDFQSTTSQGDWLAAFQEKKLCREQAKRPERNFNWRYADSFGSVIEEWPVNIHASHLES
jgi:hypothetical protein